MSSRLNFYFACVLALEAVVVRGGAPRLPERQGTLILAGVLQPARGGAIVRGAPPNRSARP
jgi:hypothetical protein